MIPLIRRFASRAIAAIVSAALIVAPVAAQSNAVGINAALRNKVDIRSAGTTRVSPAVLRQQVILNDEVRTAKASWLQILLLDKTTFTVGADARAVIDRFVYDPTANSRSTGISVTRGAFRFMSGRTLGKPSGPATVRTPVATIGIRGTIFDGVVGPEAVKIAANEAGVGNVNSDKDEASLIVLRGPGLQAQGDSTPGAIDVTAAGKTVTLDRPGMAVYVPRAGVPPIGPFQISPVGLQALQPLLRPAPEPIPTGRAKGAGGGGMGFLLPAILIAGALLGALAAGGGGGGGGGSPPTNPGAPGVPPVPPVTPPPVPPLPPAPPPPPPTPPAPPPPPPQGP